MKDKDKDKRVIYVTATRLATPRISVIHGFVE